MLRKHFFAQSLSTPKFTLIMPTFHTKIKSMLYDEQLAE